MTLIGFNYCGRTNVFPAAQAIGTDVEILSDPGDMSVGRIDNFAAQDARKCGLRHPGTAVQRHGADLVPGEQRFEDR